MADEDIAKLVTDFLNTSEVQQDDIPQEFLDAMEHLTGMIQTHPYLIACRSRMSHKSITSAAMTAIMMHPSTDAHAIDIMENVDVNVLTANTLIVLMACMHTMSITAELWIERGDESQ